MYLQVIFNILNVLFPSEVQQPLKLSQSQSSNNFLSSFCEERKEKNNSKTCRLLLLQVEKTADILFQPENT